MKMIKVTRKSPLALITVCLVSLLILYNLELGPIWYYSPRIFFLSRSSRPSCTAFRQNSSFETSHDFRVVGLRDKTENFGSNFKEFKQTLSFLTHSKYVVKLRDSQETSATSDLLSSRGDAPSKLASLNWVSDKMSYKDDVLRNISIYDVMQVTDGIELNTTLFLNWAKTHMLINRKRYFEQPRLVESGIKVCDNNTELIIIIPTIPGHAFKREIVRQTWASPLYGVSYRHLRPISLRTKIVFLIGMSGLSNFRTADLRREASYYNDIVSAEFFDSYRNLTLKTMFGLNWVGTFCSSARYVMKADLDTFVNLPLLSRFLLEISKRVPRYILGHRHARPSPPVLRSGKWSIDKEDYPFDSFPPYLFGHSYVMTSEVASMIVSIGKSLPLLPAEDAHVTGVLARLTQAPRLHYDGFANTLRKVISCRLVHNYEVSVTKMSESRLISVWSDLLNDNCTQTETPLRARNLMHQSQTEDLDKSEKESGPITGD